MCDGDQLSIYAIETPVELETGGQSFHSFLLLVDEKKGAMQELHFVASEKPINNCKVVGNFDTASSLKAITKPANRDYSVMHMSEVVSGHRRNIVSQWNKMTEIAASITFLKIAFTQGAEDEAINCRTGTKAVMRALGYEFNPLIDDPEAIIGSKQCVLSWIPDIIVDPTPCMFSAAELSQRFLNFNPAVV